MVRYKPKKLPPQWTPELAYIIGVITADGNLSSNGRHLNITSKDLDIIQTAKEILGLKNKISRKARGGSKDKKYYVLQFGDVVFYDFLLSIGLMPAKSKTLKDLAIPNEFFFDFLRGCIDGDGTIDSYMHPESLLPQHRIRLVSASPAFLMWALGKIRSLIQTSRGNIHTAPNKSIAILSFGKQDTRKILELMYYKHSIPALERKRRIAQKILKGE